MVEDELKAAREEFRLLSLYQCFEHIVIMVLTTLVAIVVLIVVWRLIPKIV